ncbi:MAG: RluA family pseudouridine synthase [Treponema sp.]|nr:RluA family pseudouridine synthase [Treponema sp.]
MKNLDILYEDNLVIVINKPAGLAVQGGKGIKSSLDKILAETRTPPPLLVHRLDKDTSGIILTAKTREAAARFSRLIGTGSQSVKQYTAVCSGCPVKKEGVITLEIPVHGSIKKSKTSYKVINSHKLSDMVFSVLELELGTGRMHQIRRHLAMIGNPVLGDDKYGDFKLNKKLRKTGVKRLLLHSSRLIIKDEINLNLSAPLPDYFQPFINNNYADGSVVISAY